MAADLREAFLIDSTLRLRVPYAPVIQVGDFLTGCNDVNNGRMSVDAAVKAIVSSPLPRVLRFVRLRSRAAAGSGVQAAHTAYSVVSGSGALSLAVQYTPVRVHCVHVSRRRSCTSPLLCFRWR